jgi:hypothetical protein
MFMTYLLLLLLLLFLTHYIYTYALDQLKFYISLKACHASLSIFIHIYSGTKFSLFVASAPHANVACREVHVFGTMELTSALLNCKQVKESVVKLTV